jgi:hypothetical protein
MKNVSAPIIGGIACLILGICIGVLGYSYKQKESFDTNVLVEDFYANVSTDFVGIAITVLFIDQLNRRRLIQQEKESLKLQMGSPNSMFAIEAVRILRDRGWLTNGSLQAANLNVSNLNGADLQNADLRNADLRNANLEAANLSGADLRGANLANAALNGVFLTRCFT